MKTKFLIPFSFFVLLIQRADAQIVLNRNYDIDTMLDVTITVAQTFDGGFIMGGLSDNLTTGGGFAVLIKTDNVGDTSWTKVWDFSPPGGDQIRSILQLDDSSYIAMGNTYDTVALNWNVIMLKLDKNGNIIWLKNYSIGTGIDLGYMVKKATDGGFVIAGRTTSNTTGPEDAYLIKTDSAGNVQWQYQYGGASFDAAYSVDLTTDGGYILGGQTYSYGMGGGDIYIIKVNSTGIFQWQKTFGTTGDDYGETVITTLEGGYAISGSIDDGTGSGNGYLVKTNSSGIMQWNKSYSYGSNFENFNIVKQQTDSTYILAGSAYLNNTVKFEGWLLKTNSYGDSIWSKTYGNHAFSVSDYFYGLNFTNDGGYIITGQFNAIGPPYQNAWLVKTDCMGNDTFWDSASCSLTTDIQEQNANIVSEIKIYPNPNDGNMQFEYNLEEGNTGVLSIYDVTGREIADYKLAVGNKVIPISETNLNSGIYFYIYKVNDSIVKTDKISIVK